MASVRVLIALALAIAPVSLPIALASSGVGGFHGGICWNARIDGETGDFVECNGGPFGIEYWADGDGVHGEACIGEASCGPVCYWASCDENGNPN